ncbi:translation-associated GTPase, partial [sediment metagenome]
DPLLDIQIINLELIESDKSILIKRKESNQKDLKRGDDNAKIIDSMLNKVEKILNDEKLISQFLNTFSNDELIELKKLQLLTAKPVLYALNKDSIGENIDGDDTDD